MTGRTQWQHGAGASASSPRTIAVITAGLSQPSSTRMLADRLAASAVADLDRRGVRARAQTIELREIARDITNNLVAGFPSPALGEAIRTVASADGLIAVTPVFNASYSGLFKSFVDILDPDSLTGMPVLIGATGGSERHSLALEYAMRPLFAYLHGIVVPTAVYAASSDWAGNAGADGSLGALAERIDRAASEFGALVVSSVRSSAPSDPFELSGDFAASLGGYDLDCADPRPRIPFRGLATALGSAHRVALEEQSVPSGKLCSGNQCPHHVRRTFVPDEQERSWQEAGPRWWDPEEPEGESESFYWWPAGP